jgi:hypothetical protein
MQWFFPTLFVVSFCANGTFRGKWRSLYYATFLLVVPLILLRTHLWSFCESTAYPCTLLLTACLLAGYRKTNGNASFARNCTQLLIDAGFSFMIGILLSLAIIAIYYSAVYIFDIKEWNHFADHVFIANLYIVIPLLFCYFRQTDRDKVEEGEELSHATQIVLNFILSPGVIIYTGILYLYSLTILVRWELPKGGIANMVMAFILCTMTGRLSQFIVSKRYYDWFYRPFSFLAIPPLILFWIGTIHRIVEYSFTEDRVYLLASGMLMTLYIFFLMSKRLGNYRLMLLISAVVIAVLTYIPGISAKSIGIAAQEHRLETLARQLSLWNDSTAQLTGTKAFRTTDTTAVYQAVQLMDCYDYLKKEQGEKRAQHLYGKNELKLSTLMSLAEKDKPEDKRYELPYDAIIPVEGYKHYHHFCHPTIWRGVLSVYLNNSEKPVLELKAKDHFAPYERIIAGWDEKATDIAPFLVKNDSCLVILDGFTRYADGSYRTSGRGVIFMK